MFLNFLRGINKKLGTMEARHASLRIRGHFYDILWADYVQFTLSNGNAFFSICYWLTFLDLHPSNICKKSMVLYDTFLCVSWVTFIGGWYSLGPHICRCSSELISTSNLSIIFNNIDVFSVWSIYSVLFSWPNYMLRAPRVGKISNLYVYTPDGLTKSIVLPMALQ